MSLIEVELLAERRHPKRRLGRHVEHDERSRAFASAEAVLPKIRVDWLSHGPVLDQGDLGSCTGNALAGLLNCEPFFDGHPLTETDAIRLYEEATKLDHVPGHYPPEDTGSSGLAVCKAAKREGLLGEYRWAFSVRAALAALRVGPVITGVSWYEGFDHPDADGLVTISGSVRGGHEFVISSYDPATMLLGAWNSWGAKWGQAGRFYFSVETWTRLLKERGDVTIPQPR